MKSSIGLYPFLLFSLFPLCFPFVRRRIELISGWGQPTHSMLQSELMYAALRLGLPIHDMYLHVRSNESDLLKFLRTLLPVLDEQCKAQEREDEEKEKAKKGIPAVPVPSSSSSSVAPSAAIIKEGTAVCRVKSVLSASTVVPAPSSLSPSPALALPLAAAASSDPASGMSDQRQEEIKHCILHKYFAAVDWLFCVFSYAVVFALCSFCSIATKCSLPEHQLTSSSPIAYIAELTSDINVLSPSAAPDPVPSSPSSSLSNLQEHSSSDQQTCSFISATDCYQLNLGVLLMRILQHVYTPISSSAMYLWRAFALLQALTPIVVRWAQGYAGPFGETWADAVIIVCCAFMNFMFTFALLMFVQIGLSVLFPFLTVPFDMLG